nr:putative DNA-directed RNA polymerase subunit Rpb7 [Oceanusvirus sp.]
MFQVVSFKYPVKLKVGEIGSNVRDVIEDRARALLEGICGEHGYVRHNTLRMTDVSSGVLSKIDMGRHYTFTASLKAEVCNPVAGLRFNALVRSINRFGMLAEGGYYDPDGTMVPVIEIIVVRNPATIKNEIDVMDLQVGDEVGVEVLGRQFELRESRISAYGRTVKSVGDGDSAAKKGGEDGAFDEDGAVDIDFGGNDSDDDVSVSGSISSGIISEEGISLIGGESDAEPEFLEEEPEEALEVVE